MLFSFYFFLQGQQLSEFLLMTIISRTLPTIRIATGTWWWCKDRIVGIRCRWCWRFLIFLVLCCWWCFRCCWRWRVDVWVQIVRFRVFHRFIQVPTDEGKVLAFTDSVNLVQSIVIGQIHQWVCENYRRRIT